MMWSLLRWSREVSFRSKLRRQGSGGIKHDSGDDRADHQISADKLSTVTAGASSSIERHTLQIDLTSVRLVLNIIATRTKCN